MKYEFTEQELEKIDNVIEVFLTMVPMLKSQQNELIKIRAKSHLKRQYLAEQKAEQKNVRI